MHIHHLLPCGCVSAVLIYLFHSLCYSKALPATELGLQFLEQLTLESLTTTPNCIFTSTNRLQGCLCFDVPL